MSFSERISGTRGGVRRLGWLALTFAAVGFAGCRDVLEVENPNNLVEEDLGDPAAARSTVNGASGTLARALGGILGIYSVATDEAVFIGSRDAWREIDTGELANPRNEFTDDAFRYMAQARWMTREAVKRLEAFDAEKKLLDRGQLARAYLYASVSYVTVADVFDDFAFSDQREARAPIGAANMGTVYDSAVSFLDKGLVIARAVKNDSLETQLLAMRARAKFSKAVWQKINPKGQTPANPLVSDAGASADAAAALGRMGADYRFRLVLANDDLAYAGEVSLAYNLMQRLELQIGPSFGRITGSALTVNLKDPITDAADPRIAVALRELQAAYINQPITIASAREMRLILAEAALAAGKTDEFRSQVNAIRALDGLPAYSGQIPARDMLKHERRVNLFLQGRRLADLYRFGDRSPEWQVSPASTAVRTPGTFFPITCIEVRSHPQDFPNVTC